MSEPAVCLNCGSPDARVFCPDCGQRHVPVEKYDVAGLVGEYTAQVVSKLKLLTTLWQLLLRPGTLTVAFMDGHRIDQVNPLWLFLFVWSTVVTVSHFLLAPETAAGIDVPPEMRELFVTVQPWFLGTLAYTTPFVGTLAYVLVTRLLFTSRWIEAWVLSLHVGTVTVLFNAPHAMWMARVGLWGTSYWATSAIGFLGGLPIVLWTALAYRHVYAERVPYWGLRFVALYAGVFALSFAWSALLGVALFVVLLVGIQLTFA